MKKIITILITLVISLSLFSCMTIKEIPSDKTASQIIQMGQNVASTGSYQSAEFCYNTVIERFGSEPDIFAQAKYELGHIYRKQKKYDKAIITFNEILEVYNAYPGYIQPKYKKLCEMELQAIEEATTPNKSKK